MNASTPVFDEKTTEELTLDVGAGSFRKSSLQLVILKLAAIKISK
jgi:hypothetical protein